MGDISTSGKVLDERTRIIRRRRLVHEKHQLEVSIEKYEIDILEAEAGIERTKETIRVNLERVGEKVAALAAMDKAEAAEAAEGDD